MLPSLSNPIKKLVLPYKKSFAETLCEGYFFEVKSSFRNVGTRSICYDKSEHSLLISHFYSNRVHVLNLATGKLRWFDHHGTTVRSIKVFNHEIITASWDGTVCVTNFDSLKPRLILTEKEMGRCPYFTISPENDFVYTYSYDSDKNPDQISNTVRKWSLVDGKLKKNIQLPGRHLSIRRSGSCEVYGNRLYVVSDTGHFHVFDSDSANLKAGRFFNDEFRALRVLNEFNMVALAGGKGNIYLCDLSGEKYLKKIKGHRYEISDLVIHPDKPEILISISFDGIMKIWKLPALELLGSIDVNGIDLWTVAVVNDLLIVGGEERDIWIYDIKNLSEIATKGRLVISDETYAFIPAETNAFYASDLSLMQVRNKENKILFEGQSAEYLLNTACDFNLFKDLFASENNDLPAFLQNYSGLYQLSQKNI